MLLRQDPQESVLRHKLTGGTHVVLQFYERLLVKDRLVRQRLQEFGGRKNNGSKPNTPGVGSRKVIRILVQQLEDAGLVATDIGRLVEPEGRESTQLYNGRIITSAGQKLLNDVAHSVRPEVEAAYPGLDKY